ncbi:RagB/SusD family nutrient uptake outer membrane protein [Chitinophaga sp. SYP-B3965]|uniref:RagB/SusD family nutrient uptake outer membrane protein n=1 Tax=Chitinophaga sp. SYP-B3965 TaxID=2663120 RepID=UPI001299E7F2|nr:RagB/SusD family nutrient uptake outer membrane protein [Chitinophaga sp. SYP-B3965]MRG44794.1 RagB/SusD family nutrient uptake outer membrane protein [Chitinophaga sp. SYP-B3965]
MKRFIYIITATVLLASCKTDLNLMPPDKLSPENAFNTEKDLQLYANSFYLNLPTGTDIVKSDALSDYLVGRTPSNYIFGTFTATQATGWTWTNLRKVNYFLEHVGQAKITDEAKNHFIGLARFFRAWFYFEMVKEFGNVPFYNKTLDVNDPDLYKPRDPRTLVMDSVLADLNFACTNIRNTKDATASQITRWVALAFKSRVCLFEGTFRKYHKVQETTANDWLLEAANAADLVMKGNQYKLLTTGAADKNYRDLFINEAPNNTEILLAFVGSKSLRVFNDANWYWTSATYGGRLSFTKTFINTYLKTDGTPFTAQPDYATQTFVQEVKNRDLRLKQSIRLGNYTRDGAAAPPDFTYTYTGYMPIKLTVDAKATDGVAENPNSLPLIRYAEVLLNYAEARLESNTFTAADWTNTIALLRARAGITAAPLPTVADTYLQLNYFPLITDPVLLEIRRERGIELSLEGFRYDDLKRWKVGQLLEQQYTGMYVPALNTLMDLNEDGKMDVSFVLTTPPVKVPGVNYIVIDNVQFKLSNGTSGYLILFDNLLRKYEDYKYYYPIPYNEIVLNKNLDQNEGWTN